MTGPHFEWDPRKATKNVAKHGITFLEAQTVFEDEEALFMPDPDNSGDEERFILLGLSAALRVLVVIHCERGDGEVIRLISARKAVPHERATYAQRRV
ncbi:MAG: BrnT family toxin [Gemmatimonadaceae bacterium]|jgi:hypothetical protein|nr:BrnT family toxin [Gemmatimonadaceae bacterium]